MSYGGAYVNRGYDYHQRRDRINEDEVPESKHTIFIRGLPGDMSTDEIREYFEDRIGPVSFDFVKTSADQQRLFVAVRFETRDDAKEAMSKYSDSDLMGHRCELSWFKDIRRYAQYQSMNQNRGRGRPVYRNRSYQQSAGRGSGRESYKRRHSDRDDDRSRSRSRDRARSSSDSRSPSARLALRGFDKFRSANSSRSRSRSSDHGVNDERDRRSPSNDTNSDRDKDKDNDGDPEKKRAKKDRKHRKSKKKRSRTASHSSSGGHSSTPERAIFGRHAPAGSPVSPNQEEASAAPNDAPTESADAEPPFPPPLAPVTSAPVRFPIRINTPANVISNTSFTIGIESDELPRRVLRMSPSAPVVTPPSVAAQEEETLLQEAQDAKPNVMAAIGLPPPPCPPLFNSEKKSNESGKLGMQTERVRNHLDESPSKTAAMQYTTEPTPSRPSQNDVSSKGLTSRFPTSSRFFAQFKEIQANLIKTVKAEPKQDEGTLRLSSLAMHQQDSEEEKRTVREERLTKLNEISLERFLVRKKKLEESFRGDCQTYAFVAKKLIEKDPSLEQSIRIALIENMEDLEKQVYDQVDAYLDTICD